MQTGRDQFQIEGVKLHANAISGPDPKTKTISNDNLYLSLNKPDPNLHVMPYFVSQLGGLETIEREIKRKVFTFSTRFLGGFSSQDCS
jgi:hypothetical protein